MTRQSSDRARSAPVGSRLAIAVARPLAIDNATTPVSNLAIIEADTEIDVVVCDLMMAGVDGAAVYEAIAARRPDLADRVLVITAGATSNRTRAFVEAHADQVMYKPLEAPRLLAAIDALVAGEPPQP